MLIGIFGSGRNGSTLLVRLLDGSPDVWMHPVEVNYLAAVSDLLRTGRVRRKTLESATTDRLRLEGELSAERLLDFYSTQWDDLDAYTGRLVDTFALPDDPARALRGRKAYTAKEFLPALLEAARDAYDRRPTLPRHIAFKTIETPFIADYERMFPEMRFVHIVRNPLANYASLKRTNMVRKGWPFWQHGGDELRMLLEKRWLPHARFVTSARVAADDRHVVVRHEDVLARPEQTIAALCEKLGIEPPPLPLMLTSLGGCRMRELDRNPSKEGVATPETVVPDMETQFRYDDVLSKRERDFIFDRTHALAARLGYVDLEGPAPKRLGLAWSWLLPDRWELMNSRSKLRLARALVSRRAYIYGSLLRPTRT